MFVVESVDHRGEGEFEVGGGGGVEIVGGWIDVEALTGFNEILLATVVGEDHEVAGIGVAAVDVFPLTPVFEELD